METLKDFDVKGSGVKVSPVVKKVSISDPLDTL